MDHECLTSDLARPAQDGCGSSAAARDLPFHCGGLRMLRDSLRVRALRPDARVHEQPGDVDVADTAERTKSGGVLRSIQMVLSGVRLVVYRVRGAQHLVGFLPKSKKTPHLLDRRGLHQLP